MKQSPKKQPFVSSEIFAHASWKTPHSPIKTPVLTVQSCCLQCLVSRFLSYTQEIWKRSPQWQVSGRSRRWRLSSNFAGTWGVAPRWYVMGLWPNGPESANGALLYQPGATPQFVGPTIPRTEGPYYPFKNYREIETPNFLLRFSRVSIGVCGGSKSSPCVCSAFARKS